MQAHSIVFKNEIAAKIKPIISSWNNITDIYAISLFVYDKGDNPCEPTFTLGYNTENQCRNSVSDASSPLEARWNYAFWLQNEELVFGESETSKSVKNWILSSKLPYFTCHEMFETDAADEVDEADFYKITHEFINILISVVQELHDTGFIKSTFPKNIPVIIHELEYSDTIAQQNIKANGLDLVQGLVDFINE